MRFALASLLLVAACSAPDDPAAVEQATITDSAGITIVQNHRPVWVEGGGWNVSVEPVLVVPDSVALGEARYIMRAERLSNGNLVVLSDKGARLLDANGALLTSFAPSGEGPGEFRYADELLILPGDTILIAQLGYGGKQARYSPDGVFVSETLIDREKIGGLRRWSECGTRLLPDLSQTNCARDAAVPAIMGGEESEASGEGEGEGHGVERAGFIRQNARVYRIPASLDTSYALGIDIGIEQQLIDLGGGRLTSAIHPFHAMSGFAAGGTPMRIAMATNLTWEIQQFTPEGKLTHIIRRDGGRRAPTAVDLKSADSILREPSGRNSAGEPDIQAKVLAAMVTPDSIPAHFGLWMASTGELLSRRWGLWDSATPGIFDVIDRDGRWLGTLTLPPKFRPLQIGADFLLGVQLDEDDIPSVVVYGLKR